MYTNMDTSQTAPRFSTKDTVAVEEGQCMCPLTWTQQAD